MFIVFITIQDSKLLGHAAMVGGDGIFNWQAYGDLDIMCNEYEVLVHTDKHRRSQEVQMNRLVSSKDGGVYLSSSKNGEK